MAVGLDREGTVALRDRIEDELLAPAVARGFKRFLARLEKAALAALGTGALTAAAEPLPLPTIRPDWASDDLLTLGSALGWWAEEVGPEVAEAIYAALDMAYISREGTVVLSGLEGTTEYLSKVQDRIVYAKPVLGLTAPADAFDAVRVAVADGQTLGWDRQELARRISRELDWTAPDHDYWRSQREQAASRLDSILDEYGPPGTPAREFMRENDPTVAALQAEQAKATLRLDADQSVWEGRAKMIARTESTGAANYAALQALAEEGAVAKEWIAAHDARTREEHAAADGQIVALGKPFDIGGYQLQMPGDPAAPAHLTINCRCTIVGSDELPAQPVPEESSAERNLANMPEGELESLMEEAMASGDFDLADRLGEELDGRFYDGTGARLRPDDPMTEGTFGWFSEQSESVQNRFLDAMDPDQVEGFMEASWAFSNEGRRIASVLPEERQMRKEFENWLDNEWVRAEEAAEGYMLTAEARARGIHPRDLWKVNERTARAWASPELKAYWDANGRLMYADFKAGYTGGETVAAKLRGTWS